MRSIEGRCLCGEVVYSVNDTFKYAGYCHCSECRRFSGSAFSAFGGIDADNLQIKKGRNNIRRYKKSDHSMMCFCQLCGSSLFVEKPIMKMVHIRMGTLNEPPTILPQMHVYTASKAAWHRIADNLPQFPTRPGEKK